MGAPEHYGKDIPKRCWRLIEGLFEESKKIYPEEGESFKLLGPLSSTFLLSMSFPVINFPFERLYRSDGILIDKGLDVALDAKLGYVFNGRFRDAPFYSNNKWSYISRKFERAIRSNDPVDAELARNLKSRFAMECAGDTPVFEIISAIRNALSHGGVSYLDAEGQSAYSTETKFFLFTSWDNSNGDTADDKWIRHLRISEEDYMRFIKKWVSWLDKPSIKVEMS